MTVVTGVSGSGKSTLVRDILYRALNRKLGNPGDAPAFHRSLSGDISRISAVEFVDQNPIGKSTRSNPATYLKAFEEIRKLYASTQGAKQMGFTASTSRSTPTADAAARACKGRRLHHHRDAVYGRHHHPREECHGKRYQKEILEIEYRGKTSTTSSR